MRDGVIVFRDDRPDPENNDDPNPEMEANPSQDDSQDAPDNENPFAGLDTPESDLMTMSRAQIPAKT